MDYEKLSDRELDALVSDRVFGFGNTVKILAGRYGATIEGRVGHWCTNDNEARLVRDRIAELGLVKQYMVGLAHQVWPVGTPAASFKGADDFSFMLHNVTARQQCIAALQALDAQQPTEKREGGK
jgi:hypothetical protein